VKTHRTKTARAGTSRRTEHTVLMAAPLPCVTPCVAPCVAAACVPVLAACVAAAVVAGAIVVVADTASRANRPTNRIVSASVNFILSF